MEHFNKLTPGQDERLAILAEECAEVVQAIMKIQRHGYDSRHPGDPEGPTNREMLADEIGDVRFAIEMMTTYSDVDEYRIEASHRKKPSRTAKYLHHNFV